MSLIEVAASIIAEDGISALTMERLGNEAGVATSLAYRFFDGRDDLVAAVLTRELNGARNRLTAAFLAGSSFEDRLRRTLAAWLEIWSERGPIIRAARTEVATHLGRATDFADAIEQDALREDREFWVSYLGEEYGMAREHAIVVATALVGLLDSAIFAVEAGVKNDVVIDSLVALAVRGIGSPRGSGR